MKIYNKEKTQILSNVDLTKGYLINDKIIKTITPSQEEIAEQYHYEFKEYANGGKDRIKIIDTPYRPKLEETIEYENIQVYIEYSIAELANIEIKTLKNWFDVEYMRLEQKYRRLHTLGKTTDEGKNAYDELVKLYQVAEQKRQRIQELEGLIDN